MKTMKKVSLSLLSIFLFTFKTSLPVVTIDSDFSQNITTKVIDTDTGIFYCGSNPSSISNQNIMSISPVTNADQPTKTSLHTEDLDVRHMALSKSGSTQRVVFTTRGAHSDTAAEDGDFLYYTDGTTPEYVEVNVPAGSFITTPSSHAYFAPDADALIRGLQANATHAFMAVNPHLPNTTLDWLSPGSAICSYELPSPVATPTPQDITEELGRTVVANQYAFGAELTNNKDEVKMAYAEIGSYKRLYVGTSIKSDTGSGNGSRSIVIYDIDDDGDLFLLSPKINPDASWGAGHTTLTNSDNTITGVLTPTTSATSYIAVHQLDVMQTTKGTNYLIICGGNGNYGDPTNASCVNGNRVWATPLVHQDAADSTVGTLAAKNETLVSGATPFLTQADATASITDQSDSAAQVGAGVLPWPATMPPTDMFVCGNAVYVSNLKNTSPAFEGGIYGTEAKFDSYGRISGWSPWRKACSNRMGGTVINDVTEGGIEFFALNPTTGKFWTVPEGDKTTVRSNEWLRSDRATNRSRSISRNSYRHLSTRNISRKIIPTAVGEDLQTRRITRAIVPTVHGTTSQAAGHYHMVASAPYSHHDHEIHLDVTQKDITTYGYFYNYINGQIDDAATHLKVTTLPSTASNATCVAATNWGADQNYWLVGTYSGLYAYLNTTTGAGAPELTTATDLSAGHFSGSTSSWVRIFSDTITHKVGALACVGNALYVLYHNNSGQDTVSRITATDDIQNATLTTLVIASDTNHFYDISIYNHDTVTGDEEICIGSDDGLLTATGGIGGGATGTQDVDPDDLTFTTLTGTTGMAVTELTEDSSDGTLSTIGSVGENTSDTQLTGIDVTGTVGSSSTNTEILSTGTDASETQYFINWDDGCRKFFHASGASPVFSSGSTTGSTTVNLGSIETAAFTGLTPKSLSLDSAGIVRIKTAEGAPDILLD